MRRLTLLVALMACLALVAACGAKEEAAPDTGGTSKDGAGAMPGKTTMEDVKVDAPDVNAKVPAGAEMRTIVLDIEGMN